MTREELEVKYPVGTKIRLVNDAQKMKDHAKKLGWGWSTGKDQIVGTEVVVIRHNVNTYGFFYLSVKHEIHQSPATDGLWSIHLDWVINEPVSIEDPDQLLKQQRDNIFASIFGGG